MSSRLRTIASLSSQAEVLAERARPAFARRLEARLKDLLGEAQLDPTRLAQEAAIAAERSDVSEEMTRLAKPRAAIRIAAWRAQPTPARKWISCCRKCSGKRTRFFRKLPGTRRRPRDHAARARNQVRNRKTAGTGAEHRMSEPPSMVMDRFRTLGFGEIHAGEEDSGTAAA